MASWAKMSSELDINPKVRKAGRDGREVFLFLVRRNAALDMGGRIPSSYLDADYLAEQLMMSRDEASNGLSRAVTAALLTIEEGFAMLVGWDDEWAKRPLTNAERQEKSRANKKSCGKETGHVTTCHDAIVTGNGNNVGEESRGDNKEVREVPPECLKAADQLRNTIVAVQPTNRLAKAWTSATRKNWAESFDRLNRLDGRSWTDISLVIHWLFYEQVGDAKFVVQSPDALREKWDRIEGHRNRPKHGGAAVEPSQRRWNEL
jgi:hypothetical protein